MQQLILLLNIDINLSLKIQKETLFIFISQSGETADTLAALRFVKNKCKILSLVNVIDIV